MYFNLKFFKNEKTQNKIFNWLKTFFIGGLTITLAFFIIIILFSHFIVDLPILSFLIAFIFNGTGSIFFNILK